MDICEKGLALLYAGPANGNAERSMRKKLAVVEDSIERLVSVPMSQHQFSALTVLVYDIGVSAFAGSTLLALLNKGRYDQVPAQMARWCKADGKRIAALSKRRAAEAALFMEPEITTDEDLPAIAMPQRVEAIPAGRVADVVKTSWTLRGALLALAGTLTTGIQNAYDWALSVARDAGPEVVNIKTALSPLDPLIKMTPVVLFAVVIIGLVIVIVRKIGDHVEGKAV